MRSLHSPRSRDLLTRLSALFERDVPAPCIFSRSLPGDGILIVDEVLAVGDASFQRKCLGKMQDVSRTRADRTFRKPQHGRHSLALQYRPAHAKWHRDLLRINRKGDGGLSEPGLRTRCCGAHGQAAAPPSRCDVWMDTVTVLCNGKPNANIHDWRPASFKVKFRSSLPITRPFSGISFDPLAGRTQSMPTTIFCLRQILMSP